MDTGWLWLATLKHEHPLIPWGQACCGPEAQVPCHSPIWSALQPAKPHSHRVCWKAKQHGPNPMPEGKDLPEKCDVRGSRAQDPALGLNSQRYL